MLSVLLTVAALGSSGPAHAFATPLRDNQDVESARPAPVVVVHDGDDRLRDELRAARALWHDAGEFLVAAPEPSLRARLERAAVAVVDLPPITDSEQLFVVAASADATIARIEAAGARVLFRHASQALVAAPAGRAGLLRDLDTGRRFHGGIAFVRRAPMAVPRPFAPPGAGDLALGVADPRVQAVVDQVDIANVEQSVNDLSAITTRCAAGPGADIARDMIVAQLQSYGYSPTLQSFSGTYSENVIAELPGTTAPEQIIVIGGHYDSIAGSCTSVSPGADDNATGTGGVMEAARVLANGGPWEHTLRFILFSAEEYGLIGSNYNSQQSVNAGEDIIAMINTDMSAYRAAGDTRDVDFVTNYTTPALRQFCADMGALYVPSWASKEGSLGGGTSDHQSFYQDGFPAVFYFEDADQYSPYIHSANDTNPLSTNDFALSEMLVKGIVAAAATLADPVDLVITHTPLTDTQDLGPYDVVCQAASLTGGNVTNVDLHHAVDGGAWTDVPMTLQGNDWSAQIPGAGSPVTIDYYITAQDDMGGSEALPDGADQGAPPFSFFVGVMTVLYFNDFEAAGDEGWTHGMDATQDDWQHGVVYGKSGDPSSAYSGTRLWGNDLGASGWNGAYQPNVSNWLRSPILNLSAAGNVHIRYQRWLTVEDGLYDQARVRVNGVVVWQNYAGTPGDDDNHHLDSAWTLHTIDVSALAAGNPSVQIEYRLMSDASLNFGGWNLDDFSLVSLEPVGCPPPSRYCTTSPNSTGSGALIDSNGQTSVAANGFELSVISASFNQPGVFYYGPNQGSVPFGDGVRCVFGGVFRLRPAVTTDSMGDASYALDFGNLPPGGDIVPGSIWNFQFWYRDPAFGGAGFNLSDALEVTFCP